MMMNVIKKYKSYSLIETIAAIAIIVVVILGVTILNNASIRNSTQSNHRMQIALFAQEQMEILRNIRDSSINRYGNWDHYFTTDSHGGNATKNFCNSSPRRRFYTVYNYNNENRYNVRDIEDDFNDDHIRINASEDDEFHFDYFLQCGEVNTINLGTNNINVRNDDRPIRFRITVQWSEYGRGRIYILNSYLTNLDTLTLSFNPGSSIIKHAWRPFIKYSYTDENSINKGMG
ncbi:hypothetical protein ACFL14_01975 [Patescibacteria group bacterium]